MFEKQQGDQNGRSEMSWGEGGRWKTEAGMGGRHEERMLLGRSGGAFGGFSRKVLT